MPDILPVMAQVLSASETESLIHRLTEHTFGVWRRTGSFGEAPVSPAMAARSAWSDARSVEIAISDMYREEMAPGIARYAGAVVSPARVDGDYSDGPPTV